MNQNKIISKTVHIQGMTCISCEMIITDELNSVDGISEVKVCSKKKVAEIKHSDSIDFQKIKSAIEKLGYRASLSPFTEDDKLSKKSLKQWIYSVGIFLMVIIVYKILKSLGLLNWINISSSDYNYGLALLVGLIASLSSCLAVVGGVVLSFASKYQTKGSFYQSNVKPHILFHIGRMGSFFLLGGLLGVLGGWLNLSNSFMGYFTVVVAVIMIMLGLNIIGLAPNVGKWGIRLPKSFTGVWKKMQKTEHSLAPLFLGAFTFFLPCGFTQSMQLFAISTGSFLRGGLFMFLFALGTLPVLGLLGVTASKFNNKKTVVLQTVIGFIVVLFALYTFASGLTLVGINTNFGIDKKQGTVTRVEDKQIVKMDVTYAGYTPNVFTIKKDVPVKWIVNVKQMTGCTNEIMIPSLGISKKLQVGENIVEFTPTTEGDILFSCWMGMVRGKFIVIASKAVDVGDSSSVTTADVLQTKCDDSTTCQINNE